MKQHVGLHTKRKQHIRIIPMRYLINTYNQFPAVIRFLNSYNYLLCIPDPESEMIEVQETSPVRL
jgi:hypothetical protein